MLVPRFMLAVGIVVLSVSSAVFADTALPVLGSEPGSRRLCNDDLGVILWGPDTAPTLSIGKSDVWDRRNPKQPEPIITLQEIMDRAKSGETSVLNGAAYYTAYNSHDFPCPKPVGQLILLLNFVKQDGVITVDQNPRSIHLTATKGTKKLDLRMYVSAVRNVIVLTGEGVGLEAGDMALRLYRHRDTILPGDALHPTLGEGKSPNDFEPLPMPKAGTDSDLFWVAQDFGKEPTFPDGFTSVLAARVTGASLTFEVMEGQTGLGTALITEKEGRLSHGLTKRFTPINQSPGSAVTGKLGALNGPFTVYATVTTTQDAADPVAGAKQMLAEAISKGEGVLWSEHQTQLDAYDAHPHARAWSTDGRLKTDVVWGGVPYRTRPFGYYGDVALCSVDTTKFCFQDSSMWHADFHFNEIDASGFCIQRQFDLLDSYFTMLRTLLPMAQANARNVYGCSGAMYPLVHYPLKSDTVIHTHMTWEQSMEISALLAKPFWLRFQYTWDLDFLRNVAYPVMREGARFYADFLKRSDDGLYHVFPTVSPEHRGITRNLEFNKDSQSSITLIRYHLRVTAQAAELLNVDNEEAIRWREIAEHMPTYPTIETPDGPIFIDVAGAQPIEYNIPVPLSSVFWGDDIGLDSPPEQIALAKRTLEKINVWEPHRGYLKRVRARLGISEPDGSLSLDNILQSHTGRIRLFPAVPAEFEGGFENLGAQGAFVCAAERTKTGVTKAMITSLAGNPCTLANPWPGKRVVVTDLDGDKVIAAEVDDSMVRFPTQKNHRYTIVQER